jgi:pimeloyl-ACP methyl ester carboxylesterase
MGGGSESVEVGGHKIAFERRGDGPPLLLVHGACGDSRDWRPQLEELSDEFTVIAWDAPGCGRSWDPPEDYGLAGYADALAGFVAALGLGRPHVLGLSFGSGLALELFRRHRDLPRSLVLASAYAGWAGSLGRKEAEVRRQWGLHASERPRDEFVGEFCDTHFTPTLLLYGDADKRSPVSVGEDLHVRIPGSRFVVIPGPGHVVNIETPERFNEEVRSFLREVG